MRAFDTHDWRDAGVGSGALHVQELTPAQRKAALEAQEKRDAENAEALRESLAAPVVAEKVMGEHIAVAVSRASVIETEAEKRARQLGFVEVNGKLMHKTEASRRAELREQDDGDGITPEERRAMEQYLASDDEEEDIWHDVEE
jgi:hypothetical protein